MQGPVHVWPNVPDVPHHSPYRVRRSAAVPCAPRKRREISRSPLSSRQWVDSLDKADLPDAAFWPDAVPKKSPTLQRSDGFYEQKEIIEPGSAENPINLATPTPSPHLLCEEDFPNLSMGDWDIESVPEVDFSLPPPMNNLCFHDNVFEWHIHSRK